MREILSEVNPRTGRTELEQLLRQLLRRAHQGNDKCADTVLERAFGRAVAVQQNLNLNANMSNECELSLEEVRAELDKRHEEMGIPPTVVTVQGHRQVNREAVKARVEELLAKREERKAARKPPPQLTQGSGSIQ